MSINDSNYCCWTQKNISGFSSSQFSFPKENITPLYNIGNNPFCDVVNIRFISQSDESCIGTFLVHKFVLLQCKYFQIMFNTDWIISDSDSDSEKNLVEIQFLDKSWFSESSTTVFIKCLYNSDSKKILASQTLQTCIEIHRLLDFFEFEFLRSICSKEIILKLQNDNDYCLLSKYINEITTVDEILEKVVKNWFIWKSVSLLSSTNEPKIISETSFSTGFEISYTKATKPLPSFLTFVNNQQRRFSCFGIEWLFQISRTVHNCVTISLAIEGGETLSKYEIALKFGIYGKENSSSLFQTMWLISGQPKTTLCTIDKLSGNDAFYSSPESKFFVPVFLVVDIKRIVHPIDFTFRNQQ